VPTGLHPVGGLVFRYFSSSLGLGVVCRFQIQAYAMSITLATTGRSSRHRDVEPDIIVSVFIRPDSGSDSAKSDFVGRLFLCHKALH
jgi:hypothetical protein